MTKIQLAGLGIAGAVATIVGCIGTWATYQGHPLAGTDANRGKTTAIAAGVALVLLSAAALGGWRLLAILAALASILSFAFVVWSLANINGFVGAPAGVSIGRGWGIWLAIIGSAVLLLASLLLAAGRGLAGRPAATTAAP